jgi:uncharacterized protein (UPF0332 family)
MPTEPFDWSDYFKLAGELAKRTEDSCRRTAIGRAYYYVFHLARKRIEANGFTLFPGGDSHKQVWEKFSGSAEADCKKLGEIAKRLKEKRQRADYDDFYARLGDNVPAVLADAQDFAYRLARLPSRLPANIGVRR